MNGEWWNTVWNDMDALCIEIRISIITEQAVFLKDSDVLTAQPNPIVGGINQVMVVFVEQVVLPVNLVHHYVIERVRFSSCSSALEDSVDLSIES
jgi:hypothetical protein